MIQIPQEEYLDKLTVHIYAFQSIHVLSSYCKSCDNNKKIKKNTSLVANA